MDFQDRLGLLGKFYYFNYAYLDTLIVGQRMSDSGMFLACSIFSLAGFSCLNGLAYNRNNAAVAVTAATAIGKLRCAKETRGEVFKGESYPLFQGVPCCPCHLTP